MAKVATSAQEAFDLGLLRGIDKGSHQPEQMSSQLPKPLP